MKNKLTPKQKKKYVSKRAKIGHGPGCTKTLGKHYKPGSKGKKRLTAKQRASLSKGRSVLKHIRRGRKVAEPKEPILIKEGVFMAAKRKSKKKNSRKMSGVEGKYTHKRKSHKRGHSKRFAGAESFSTQGFGIDIAGLLLGSIGVSMALPHLIHMKDPKKNARTKALIATGLGLLGLFMKKTNENRLLNRASLGALAIGAHSLIKTIHPKTPHLGAADTAEGIGFAIDALPTEEKAILGVAPAQLEYNGTDVSRIEGQSVTRIGSEADGFEGTPGDMLGAGDGNMLGDDGLEGDMLGAFEQIGAEADFE